MTRYTAHAVETIAALSTHGTPITHGALDRLQRENLIPRRTSGDPLTDTYLAHVTRANELRTTARRQITIITNGVRTRRTHGVALALAMEGYTVDPDVVRDDIAGYLTEALHSVRNTDDDSLERRLEVTFSPTTLRNVKHADDPHAHEFIRSTTESVRTTTLQRIRQDDPDATLTGERRYGLMNLGLLGSHNPETESLIEPTSAYRAMIPNLTDDERRLLDDFDLTYHACVDALNRSTTQTLINASVIASVVGRLNRPPFDIIPNPAPNTPIDEARDSALCGLSWLANPDRHGDLVAVFNRHQTRIIDHSWDRRYLRLRGL